MVQIDLSENNIIYQHDLQLPCEEVVEEGLPVAAVLLKEIEDDPEEESHIQNNHHPLIDSAHQSKVSLQVSDTLETEMERSVPITVAEAISFALASKEPKHHVPPFLPGMKSNSSGEENSRHSNLPTQDHLTEGPTNDLFSILENNVMKFSPWCQKVTTDTTRSNTSDEIIGKNESTRIFPCRARGIESSHNAQNAFIEVPVGCVHGTIVVCSNSSCAGTGRQFRYCSVCDRPVAKRNFTKRHSHGHDLSSRCTVKNYKRETHKNKSVSGATHSRKCRIRTSVQRPSPNIIMISQAQLAPIAPSSWFQDESMTTVSCSQSNSDTCP